MFRYAILLTCLMYLIAPALGDEIIFKNGDRLTGKITGADGGKVTIDTSLAGSLSVPMDQIKTFSTDAPLTLKLRDGSIVNDQITAAGTDGAITTKGVGPVKSQTVALIDIDKINPPPVKWSGSIAVGGIVTRGNSKSQSLNTNVDAVRRGEDDRISFDAGYFFSRQKDKATGQKSTTTDNWFIAGKYDYFFSKKLYGYAMAKVERDRIANLDLRFSPGGGLGYQWVESADLNFRTEAGISWVYQTHRIPATATVAQHNESDDHVAARLAYHVDKVLTQTLKAYHNLEFFPSLENGNDFTVNSDVGLRAARYKNMFAELKAEWKYDSNPAMTVPKTYKNDFRYILNVGWTF
jgi:putative salt-induced outer membrane protein YdiY